MKQRKLERKAKVVSILTAAGIPADKVEATAEEIDGVYTRRPPRRLMPQRVKLRQRPPRKPDAQATPPVEAAAPAAK